MPKRYGKQTMRIRREARQTVRGLAAHGLVAGTMRGALRGIGFSPEEAARLTNETSCPNENGPLGAR